MRKIAAQGEAQVRGGVGSLLWSRFFNKGKFVTLIFNLFLLKMTLLTLLSVNVTIIRQGGQDDPSFFSHPSFNPLAPSETKALLQKSFG